MRLSSKMIDRWIYTILTVAKHALIINEETENVGEASRRGLALIFLTSLYRAFPVFQARTPLHTTSAAEWDAKAKSTYINRPTNKMLTVISGEVKNHIM